MPVRSDEPLRKVTLNLYESDCQWFEKEYGHGWTERIRQHVQNYVHNHKSAELKPRTLADIANESQNASGSYYDDGTIADSPYYVRTK